VVAAPFNRSAIVTWSAPGDNGGAPITSYTITTTGPAAPPALISGTATATATIGGLTNGATYTFKVAATNAAGVGANSPVSNAVVPLTVPGAPTSVVALPGDGSVAISWLPPADPGGSPISSYTVTARLLGTQVRQVTIDAPATSVLLADLVNGSGYTFTVSAANGSGSGPRSSPVGPVTPAAPDIPVTVARVRSGYWMLEADGRVYAFGDAPPLSDPRGQLGTAQAVDLEPTPSGNGFWVVDDAGRVYGYGDALFHGNLGSLLAGERVTSLSATPSGNGYWIFTTRGRVATFGDATFHGDMSAVSLNGPVRDSVPTPTGKGYYMVASDGGIFAFGDAKFYGSMGATRLNAPVQSLVPDADGVGYWLVAADGGIFAFDAPFRGSMGATPLNQPVTGMVRSGNGYLMVGEDGGIFDFSGTVDGFKGSLGANPPAHPIVAVAVLEEGRAR
jgi:hypothetical protein